MKILIVPDVKGWAIDGLVQSKIKHNPHHIFKCDYVHPRDAGQKSRQEAFEKTVREFEPDIIQFEYFRSASQLLEALPFLKDYKIILTHHNQRKDKALKFKDWNALGVDILVTHTEKAAEILREECHQKDVRVIKHGIDLDYFSYIEEEPKEFTVGYAGRIVPWKNLKLVAEACYELKIPLMFMGRQDKADYWASKRYINFSFMDCRDEERLEYYKSITCYIGMSCDGYEEGTLEYFEAMATGRAIISTPSGSVADIGKDRDNCLLINYNKKEELKEALLELKDNDELKKQLKKNGWETVKNYSEQRMAYNYSKLYYELFGGEEELISVILPTYNHKEQVIEILDSIKNQTYKNLEVCIGDDGSDDGLHEAVNEWREKNTDVGVKIIGTGNEILRKEGKHIYGLAKARNLAVTLAEGKYLVFIDNRIKPREDAIMNFRLSLFNSKRVWFFGNKDGAEKKSFVENFSAVKKDEFVKFGMFNERIDLYGGMSQEIRERWQSQFGEFFYLGTAEADVLVSSKRSKQRRKDIIKMKDLLYRLNS